MFVRKSSAAWMGTLKEGRGTMQIKSAGFEGPYSFGSRFQDGVAGTNPEELLGAAFAGCFSMFLAQLLEETGHNPKTIETQAKVHLERGSQGFKISTIELVTNAQVPDIEERVFLEKAEAAKKNCPVSKIINIPVSLSVSLNK